MAQVGLGLAQTAGTAPAVADHLHLSAQKPVQRRFEECDHKSVHSAILASVRSQSARFRPPNGFCTPREFGLRSEAARPGGLFDP
ncbi:MAG: hypothetical protein DCC49_05100 [Acidobacteria bacterium]|nr:MAG: hypothetical protein DCC49_05100 [Acidobacteriota bacterium]